MDGDDHAVLVIRRFALEEYLADHCHELFPEHCGNRLDQASEVRQHFGFKGGR